MSSHGSSEDDEERQNMIDQAAEECMGRVSDCIVAMNRPSHSAAKEEKQDFFSSPVKLIQQFYGDRPPLERGKTSRLEIIDRLVSSLDDLHENIQEIYKREGLEAANRIVYELATVPLLVQTIVLMKDKRASKTILNHPCLRRLLCCKATALSSKKDLQGPAAVAAMSVRSTATSTSINQPRTDQDSWILESLRSKRDSSVKIAVQQRRVIDYLDRISNLTTVDFVSILLTRDELDSYEAGIFEPEKEFVVAFYKERDELFETISSFKRLIPLIFALENNLVERASLLPVVESALDDAVRRPFMIAEVFTDLFFYMVLLMVVRNFIFMDVLIRGLKSTDVSQSGFFLLYCFGPTAVFYLLCRLLGGILAFTLISRSAFVQNLLYRWTLVDVVSVGAIITGVVVGFLLPVESKETSEYGAFQAVMLGLVWLKALGFMQNLNPTMAAHIIFLFETLRDIWQFLLILLVVVLGFGDMFNTIYANFRDDVRVCPDFGNSTLAARIENRIQSPFCNIETGQGYVSVYRVLVGDFSVGDFDATAFSTFLYVCLSFFSIIILLNMLIALILQCYERSVSKSKGLFGRTRVAFVSKSLLAEESLTCRTTWVGMIIRLFYGVSLVLMACYTMIMSVFYSQENSGYVDAKLALAVLGITVFLSLYFCLLARRFYSRVHLEATTDNPENLPDQRRGRLFCLMDRLFNAFIGMPAAFITRRVLGVAGPKKNYRWQSAGNTENGDLDDDDEDAAEGIEFRNANCARRGEQRKPTEFEQRITMTLLRVEDRLAKLEKESCIQAEIFSALLRKLQSADSSGHSGACGSSNTSIRDSSPELQRASSSGL